MGLLLLLLLLLFAALLFGFVPILALRLLGSFLGRGIEGLLWEEEEDVVAGVGL